MPVIYIRDVSEEDVRALRVAAAGAGLTLPDYCLGVLRESVNGEGNGSDPVAQRTEGEEAENEKQNGLVSPEREDGGLSSGSDSEEAKPEGLCLKPVGATVGVFCRQQAGHKGKCRGEGA